MCDFLVCATSKSNPTRRTIIPKTIPKENLPPASRTSGCRAPRCKPSPLRWNGRHLSRFEFPDRLRSFPDVFSIPRIKRTFPSFAEKHHTQCTSLSYDQCCRGLPFVCLGEKRVKVRTVHVLVSPLDVTELSVKFPRCVSCQFFLATRSNLCFTQGNLERQAVFRATHACV